MNLSLPHQGKKNEHGYYKSAVNIKGHVEHLKKSRESEMEEELYSQNRISY